MGLQHISLYVHGHASLHVHDAANGDLMSSASSPNARKARRQCRAALDIVGLIGEVVGIDVGPAGDGLHSIFLF